MNIKRLQYVQQAMYGTGSEGEMVKSQNGVKKILVVEDTRIIADCLADMLKQYGTVNIASSGEEALIKGALNFYDVIISDIKMPVMDGIEFYKTAVEIHAHLKDRFLFYTSSFEKEHLNFIIEHDLPLLFRPARREEVESTVCEILDGSQRKTV